MNSIRAATVAADIHRNSSSGTVRSSVAGIVKLRAQATKISLMDAYPLHKPSPNVSQFYTCSRVRGANDYRQANGNGGGISTK